MCSGLRSFSRFALSGGLCSAGCRFLYAYLRVVSGSESGAGTDEVLAALWYCPTNEPVSAGAIGCGAGDASESGFTVGVESGPKRVVC